jgi:hypothetical protein
MRPVFGPRFTTKYCSPLDVVTTPFAAAFFVRKSGPGAVLGGAGGAAVADVTPASERAAAMLKNKRVIARV